MVFGGGDGGDVIRARREEFVGNPRARFILAQRVPHSLALGLETSFTNHPRSEKRRVPFFRRCLGERAQLVVGHESLSHVEQPSHRSLVFYIHSDWTVGRECEKAE